MNNLDWTLLQTFQLVGKHGSLTEAAKAQNTSQPTVSRHISKLEEDLGYRLFDRSKIGSSLTPRGEALLEYANEMAASAAKLYISGEGQEDEIAGSVRLTASRIVATFLLPEILTQFHSQEPNIQIELVVSDETENLLHREADIAVRMYRPKQPDRITRKVTDLRLGAYAAHSYIERKGEPKAFEEILEHDVIGYDRSTLIIDGFRNFGINVSRDFFAFKSDDQAVCWQMVVAGFGIGFNQTAIGDKNPKVKRLNVVGDVGNLPVWLTAHSALKASPRIRKVYDFLAENLKAIT